MHKCDGCRYKGEYQEMMFRPMGVCNRGSNLVEAVQNYEAEKCPYKKSNADKIRAMSDEELSVFLWEFDKEETARTTEYALERRKITEWLKQPAE